MKIKWIFGVIIIILLLFAVSQIDSESLLYSLQKVPVHTLLLVLGMQIITQLLVNLQWYRVAKTAGIFITFWNIFYVNCHGAIVDAITPGVKFGGEAARLVKLKTVANCTTEQAAAVIAVQKIFSLSALFMVILFNIFGLLSLLGGSFLSNAVILSGAIIIFLFFLMLLLMPQKIYTFLHKKSAPRYALTQKIHRVMLSALQQLGGFAKGAGLSFFALSVFIWLFYPIKLLFILRSFFPEANISQAYAATFAAYLTAMLPIFPGGLGGFESALTGGLYIMGLTIGAAATVAVVFRFITFWFVVLASICYIGARKMGGLKNEAK
ncbi:MAG: flippase-like domain-containing protein [Defluviitaleaceae bacterium]|nr:flippase-like domain-containing protein [Defluviitaleaceae bacterium]MCL2274588.1 flippase-like domain-containing protein [Defluviitaleaceae bacterium]